MRESDAGSRSGRMTPPGGLGSTLLQSVTDFGRHIFSAAACSLAVLAPDEEHLVFEAASGAGAEKIVGLRLPIGRGIAGWVVSSGQPIAVRDVRSDPRFAHDVADFSGYLPHSILATPMETERGSFGLVEVLDRTPVEGRDDMVLLALLARHAALTVELARSTGQPGPRDDAGPTAGDPAAMLTELGRLGAAEQQMAAAVLGSLLAYLGRPGGPSSVV